VVRALGRLRFDRGLPQRIYCDNVSEFVSAAMDLWAYTNKVILDFSRRGRPTDNATIESFNGRFRSECLNVHRFLSLEDAEETIEARRRVCLNQLPMLALHFLAFASARFVYVAMADLIPEMHRGSIHIAAHGKSHLSAGVLTVAVL
jgi:transposase InsO family protein